MPPKRPATEQASERAPKRSNTSSDDVVAVEATSQFNITVELNEEYLVYPADLRRSLQYQFKTTIQEQIIALTTSRPFKSRYTFIIVQEDRERSSDKGGIHDMITHKRNIPTASLANAALLDLDITDKMVLNKPKFEHLKRSENIANPENVRLHAVRNGEVGWGFDCHGCLSLYTVKREKGKLMEYAVFVKRLDGVKVEQNA